MAHQAFEILFRASSEADGVQSRGAGWHPARGTGRSLRQGLKTLSVEVAEGDLALVESVARGLYVYDGKSFKAVAPLSSSPRDRLDRASSAFLARVGTQRALGWESAPDAAWLLYWARRSCPNRLLIAAALDCARTVLRFVQPPDLRVTRALRLVDRYLSGLETLDDVREAAYLAQDASLEAEEGASYRAANAVCFSIMAIEQPWDAHIAARTAATTVFPLGPSSEATARSLAFLVRARIPGWKACLAPVSLSPTLLAR